MRKIFKRFCSTALAVLVLMLSCLSVFAATDGYQGKTYDKFERAQVKVTVGDMYTYAGWSGIGVTFTHHYRINDRTAFCVWTAKGEVTAMSGKLGKYILKNTDARSKSAYYLSWASNVTSPDKVTTGYYDTISSSFLTAYKKTDLAQFTTLNSKSTYQDVVIAALKYVQEMENLAYHGEAIGTSKQYQYCMSHALLDYLQQGSHNNALGLYWTAACETLAGLVKSLPATPDEARVFYCYPAGTKEQSLMSIEETPINTGYAKIIKKSSNTELTDGNDCYSLEGAVYTLYTDAACTDAYSEIVTDANGEGTTGEIVVGTYYVKETTAPKGYALDTTVYPITVKAKETAVLELEDIPQRDPIKVLLQKRNATTGETVDWRMEGAEYTFKYYDGYYTAEQDLVNIEPTRSWVLKIDEYNYAVMDNDHLVSGDEFYYFDNSSDEAMLPLGTLTIQETKAPTGFYLDETLFIQQITSVGQDVIVNSYNTPVSDEFEIEKLNIKVKKEWNDEDDRDGIRPESISVNLYRDNSTDPIETAVLTAENNWEYEFTELPEGCVDYESETLRHYYEYTLSEVTVDGYTTESTGLVQDENDEHLYTCTFTNTHVPERINLSGLKRWSDYNDIMGYRPDSIIVHLYDADDMNTPLQTVVATAENNWKYEFTNLYKYKNHGEEIVYTVKEDEIDYYKASVSGMNITNRIITGSVTLTKDSGTQEPLKGVEFELYRADGTLMNVTFAGSNYVFTNAGSGTTTLKTDANGQIVVKNIPVGEYYFIETATLDGYMPYVGKISFQIKEGYEQVLNPSVAVRNNKIMMYNTGGNGDFMYYLIAIIGALIGIALIAVIVIKNYNKKGKTTMKKFMSLFLAVMLIGTLMFSCIPVANAASNLNLNTKTSFSFLCDKPGYEFSIYNVGTVVKSSNPYEVKYDSNISELSDSILNGDSVALLTALDELSVDKLGNVVGTYNTTTDGATKAFTEQAQGIYYVRATNFPAGVREVTNSVFALPYYTAEDGWIYSLENIALASKVVDDIPEIEKTITNSTKDNVNFTDVSLGDTVDFEIKTSQAGSYSNTASKDFRLKSYIITDKMSKGLTLDPNSFEVKLVDKDGNTVATLDKTTDYVVDIKAVVGADTDFTVSLTETYLQEVEFYGANVTDVITSYSAVLNKYATTAFEGNPNEAVKLTYSNKNGVTAEVEGNKVYAYTYAIQVNKQDEEDKPLENAEFAMYKTEADAKAQSNAIATGKSDATGLVEFKNTSGEVIRLQSGTYYLIETKAPEGYNRYTDVIEVKISAEYAETFTDGTWISSAPENGTAVVTVTDSKVIFPQTGGKGMMMFYIVGALGIMLTLVLLAVAKKRRTTAQ